MPSSPKPATPSTYSILFHLGYTLPSKDLRSSLHQVRFVLLCGSISRAKFIASLFHPGPHKNLCRTDRYTILSPHPSVLVAAHGIGTGSIDVLLHELHIALRYADVNDYSFIRIGSCGGINVPPGTVVVSKRSLNGLFEPALRLFVLGKEHRLPAELDDDLGEALHHKGVQRLGNLCVRGDTLCAETFYLAQGRRDGAFADYTEKQRIEFLYECARKGVVNFEMESLALAAFAKRVGVKAAVVCAVFVDRMEHETPTASEMALDEFQHRAVSLVVDFVKDHISDVDCGTECQSMNSLAEGLTDGNVTNPLNRWQI